MSLTINGKTPESITIEGKAVESLSIRGEIVWPYPNYFYIQNMYNGVNNVTLKKNGTPTKGSDLEYSLDKQTWTTCTYDANNECVVQVSNLYDKIYYRSTTYLNDNNGNYYSFDSDQDYQACGDVRTLLNYTDPTVNNLYRGDLYKLFYGSTHIISARKLDFAGLPRLSQSICGYMFYNCTSLVDGPEVLPGEAYYSVYSSMFEGCTSLVNAPRILSSQSHSNGFQRMFYGCTSLTTVPEIRATSVGYQGMQEMFSGCTSLVTLPHFNITTISSSGAMSKMFYGCTSLTTAPELSATTLNSSCYSYMFSGCTSLTTAPELPATTLADSCYSYMFSGCTSLTTAPELSATNLTKGCYYGMFSGCTSLTTAPELPATTLATPGGTWNDQGCYGYMFANCSSLTTAPELPATTLTDYCYAGMFQTCTSLTTAPELPATTLANNCYYYMFYGCTSLIEAPELPATTLANRCYSYMFYGCTSLTTAPELPATTLANNCYSFMFNGCVSLIRSPYLPATSLVSACYSYMFSGCSNLNKIIISAQDISASGCIDNWVQGVSATGDFYNLGGATYSSGASGIPSGWTEKTTLYNNLYVENDYNGSNSITLKKNGNPSTGSDLEYSLDNTTFTPCVYDTNGECVISLANQTDKVYFRGTTGFSESPTDYYSINSAESIIVGGNLESLSDYLGYVTQPHSYEFVKIFSGNTSNITCLIDFNIFLSLSTGCFMSMFEGCTGLTTCPNLPTMYLAANCYEKMFKGCTSITTIPSISATTIPSGAMKEMFSGCTSLTTVDLSNITSIYADPNNIEGGMQEMFSGCTSLNKVYGPNVSTWNDDATYNWLYDVSVTGKLKPGNIYVQMTSGPSGIPSGWDIVELKLFGYIHQDPLSSSASWWDNPIDKLAISTGIEMTMDISFRVKFMYKGSDARLYYGANRPSYTAWRFYNMGGNCHYDIENESYTGPALVNNTYYDLTFGNCYVYDNINGTYWYQGTTQGLPVPHDYLQADIGRTWLKSFEVFDGNGNTLFNGVAAEYDDQIGLYDYVSGQMKVNNYVTVVGEEPYNALSYIHAEPLAGMSYDWDNPADFYAIVTGIRPTENMSFRVKFKYMGVETGAIYFGSPGLMGEDNWRFFNVGDTNYYDISGNRWQGNGLVQGVDYDLTCGNKFIYDNINQTYWVNDSPVPISNISQYPDMQADIGRVWLKSFEVFDDNGNTVFNGVAAEVNNVYGLWDIVSNQLITNSFVNLTGEPYSIYENLYLENTSNTTGEFYVDKRGEPSWIPMMQYSLDNENWITYDFSTRPHVNVPSGDKIWFRGTNPNGFCRQWDAGWSLQMNVSHKVGGNLLSLQDYENLDTVNSIPYHGVSNIFYDNNTLVDAYDMNFGVLTSLTEQGAAAWLFTGCSALQRSPNLSQITSATGWRCMNNMFESCTSLSTIYAPNVSSWYTNEQTMDWVDNVAATGTMYCPAGVTISTDANGIPSGWTRVDYQ